MIKVNEKNVLYLKFILVNSSFLLFDYSNKDIKEINTVIEDSSFIILKNNNYKIFRVDNQSNIDSKRFELLLFHIRKNKNNNYSLENPIPIKLLEDNSNSLNDKLWFIINSNISNNGLIIINEDYYLCENDIIKFANIKYIVQKIHINSNKNHNINNEEETTVNTNNYNIMGLNENFGSILVYFHRPKCFYEILNEENNIICYFCKNYECSKENPIIKLCDCYFLHYECLKNEIINNNTYIISNKNVRNIYIKKYKCTSCHLHYPLRFTINEKNFELFKINNPFDNDYLILESIENKMFHGYLKLIHIIKLNEDQIKIGRYGKNNDVIISDPSISREHALLEYNKKKGKILIKNISNTYGSLILIKKSLKINENKIQIQVGKTYIEAQMMKYGEFEKIKNRNTKNPLPKKD